MLKNRNVTKINKNKIINERPDFTVKIGTFSRSFNYKKVFCDQTTKNLTDKWSHKAILYLTFR